MTFILSKVFWIIFRPLNLIILLLTSGLALRRFSLRLRKIGGLLTGLAFALLFVLGFTNIPDYLLHKLEKPQHTVTLPAAPAGIIVLGGGLDGRITFLRGGGYELNSASDRLIAGFELANRYPGIPLVYSGGSSALDQGSESGAVVAQRIARALYGERRRFILEDKSRNTWENAKFSYRLLAPKPGQIWIVVTSAFHALRVEGVFRQVGFKVVVWPTDFRSGFNGAFKLSYKSMDQLYKSEIVIREFLGVVYYSLMDRMQWPF